MGGQISCVKKGELILSIIEKYRRGITMNNNLDVKKYNPLIGATGLGSALGSGIIVALGITIT